MVRGVTLALVLLTYASLAPGQGQEIHGENSVFAGHGVAIAWGVLKGQTEDETQVILRIVPTSASFAAVRIEGVDPFTQNRRVFMDGQTLGNRLEVRTPRSTFADFPRREIKLYRTEDDWKAARPAVTIYFLGLPDTTPEFTSASALETYLADALAKVQDPGRGKRP